MILRKALRPIIILFVLVNLLGMALYTQMPALGIDVDVFLAGNLFVCVLTLFSFWMLFRGLKAKSTAGFLSSVYSSFIIKLAFAGLLVFAYAKLKGAAMNTPAIFASLFLYLLYTFLEVKGVLSMIRKD
jgi:hypothetical protein